MTREMTIEQAQEQAQAEPVAPRQLGRAALHERYEPIRQPGIPNGENTPDTTKREPRAVSRFGGQTLLDHMRAMR